MKKLVVALTVLTLLIVGAIAYAHSPEWYSGGHGYGYHMTGTGYGGHMMEWTGEYDQTSPDETYDVRKEQSNERFRKNDERLYTKSPRGSYRGPGSYCW
jgi:hypothetical protein